MQSSKTKGWKGDGGLGGLSPEATEKVSHLVPRMEDERRALHSCTAPRGPFCKHQRRAKPTSLECEDARLEPSSPVGSPGSASFLFACATAP